MRHPYRNVQPGRPRWAPLAKTGLVCALVSACSYDVTLGGFVEQDLSAADEASTCTAPADGYCVAGNRVLDANGSVRVFRGVVRPSLEWLTEGESLTQSDFEQMASRGANTVRLPLNQQYWLDNQDNYQPTVVEMVRLARSAGMDVILVLHRSTQGGTAEVPAQFEMADLGSRAFWGQVAEVFRDDQHVLFELYNSPSLGAWQPEAAHWELWRNGGAHPTQAWQVAGMQQLYDEVRAAGAENLVIVGGLVWAYDLSGIPDFPLDGQDIIYAVHLFPSSGKLPGDWQDAWAYLIPYYPIIISEFGVLSESCQLQYIQELINLADAEQLGWTAWAWYPESDWCRFPALFTDWDVPQGQYTLSPYGELVLGAL